MRQEKETAMLFLRPRDYHVNNQLLDHMNAGASRSGVKGITPSVVCDFPKQKRKAKQGLVLTACADWSRNRQWSFIFGEQIDVAA